MYFKKKFQALMNKLLNPKAQWTEDAIKELDDEVAQLIDEMEVYVSENTQSFDIIPINSAIDSCRDVQQFIREKYLSSGL